MPKEFVRGKAPMTKEEVRLLSVARLCLKENDVLYDIGSGTGSIAVFAASLSPKIKAYAIECNDEAVSLIKENAARFHTENVTVIKEMAPEGLEKLEKAGDECSQHGKHSGDESMSERICFHRKNVIKSK